MAKRKHFLLAASLFVAAALPVVAQMGVRPPVIRGVWNPVVGSGAAYEQVEKDGTKRTFNVSIVDKEDVNGDTAYWTEMAVSREGGDVVMQQLILVKNGAALTQKTRMMIPGRGAMEMSGDAGRGGAQAEVPKSDLHGDGEKVGNESITTPAGTFDCEHWRAKDGSYEAWISPKVTPWGVVKGTGTHGTLTLVKMYTDAKSHITGPIQKIDPSMFGRRGN